MSYWFVECDPVANRNLMELLDSLGLGTEAPEPNRLCSDGKRRNLLHLPSELVTALKKAKRSDVDRVLYQFKFFVAKDFNGTPSPANFIEQTYTPKRVREVQEELTERAVHRKLRTRRV